jgi:hypothetical protein
MRNCPADDSDAYAGFKSSRAKFKETSIGVRCLAGCDPQREVDTEGHGWP